MSINDFAFHFLAMLFWFLSSASIFTVALLMYLKLRPLPFIIFSIPIYFDGFLLSYITLPFFLLIMTPINMMITFFWFLFAKGGKDESRGWDYMWAFLSVAPIQILSLLFGRYLESLNNFSSQLSGQINNYWWLVLVVPHLLAFTLCIWKKFKKGAKNEENSGTSPS